MTDSGSIESTGSDGQDGADRQDAPGSDVGGALATGDGNGQAGGLGGSARAGASKRRETSNDVDAGADSAPDPEGYGPLSDGKDGQQFG